MFPRKMKTMFNIRYEDSFGILNYDSDIAVVLYGDHIQSELIMQSLDICNEKFKLHKNITYFYDLTDTSAWENLYQAKFKKRKFEVDNRKDFHYIIAINVKHISAINIIKFDNIKCADFSLHYFSGFFNNSSWKTSINDAGFFCTSRIFDLASNFVNVRENIEKLAGWDKSFGDQSPEHAFYYYLKTLNLRTYCATTLNAGLYQFKEITE